MPDTIIETLEAIKLFLIRPEDRFPSSGRRSRLVKYAVRRRSRPARASGWRSAATIWRSSSNSPFGSRQLGRTEIETYINLLFAKTGGMTAVQFEEARTRATPATRRTLLDVRFNHGVAAEILRPSTVPSRPRGTTSRGSPTHCPDPREHERLPEAGMQCFLKHARHADQDGEGSRHQRRNPRVLTKLTRSSSTFRLPRLRSSRNFKPQEQVGHPVQLAQAEQTIRPSPDVEVADPEPWSKTDKKKDPKAASARRRRSRRKPAPACEPDRRRDADVAVRLVDDREWLERTSRRSRKMTFGLTSTSLGTPSGSSA